MSKVASIKSCSAIRADRFKSNGVAVYPKIVSVVWSALKARIRPNTVLEDLLLSTLTRGAGDSDGSIVIMGKQEDEDGHDVIEALAKMDWYVGNSCTQGVTLTL